MSHYSVQPFQKTIHMNTDVQGIMAHPNLQAIIDSLDHIPTPAEKKFYKKEATKYTSAYYEFAAESVCFQNQLIEAGVPSMNIMMITPETKKSGPFVFWNYKNMTISEEFVSNSHCMKVPLDRLLHSTSNNYIFKEFNSALSDEHKYGVYTQRFLQKRQISDILWSGCFAERCVMGGAIDALKKGYNVRLITDLLFHSDYYFDKEAIQDWAQEELVAEVETEAKKHEIFGRFTLTTQEQELERIRQSKQPVFA